MSSAHFFGAPRVRQGLKSLGLALLMAVITMGAVKVFGLRWHPQRSGVAPARERRGFGLAHDQVLVPVAEEPGSEATAAPETAAPASVGLRKLSASEMFQLAKQARERGDVAEAIRLSQQIEQYFPNSPEGIDTHLALGVLYLGRGEAGPALQEFATFRRIGSPEAKAEAYFGQAKALRLLGRAEDERIVLEALCSDYPRSAYVAAARLRIAELASDAGLP